MSDTDDTGTSRTSVRLRWGGASDVGQLRQVNEDSMLLGPDVFVVADGMGGHAAGDVASHLAVETIDRELSDDDGNATRVIDLIAAVQSANDAIYGRSAQEPGLAGMGTTVVAIALVVEDDEQRIAIVNVGDSRAYRLTQGDLQQVSADHSLVGELVREGRLTREAARTHPQKNIVTRAVGLDEYVDVDEFQILPRTGDRYLLCSDGLTDELTETDIASVLRTVEDPDDAAAELVRRANEHGGRDNITIVIVDVLDDGLGDTARAALPDDEHFSHDPDQDTQSLLAVPDDQAHLQNAGGMRGGPDRRTGADAAPDGAGAPARTPRAITVRSLAFVLAVIVLVGAGGWLAYNYARNTYFVTIDADEVTIFRGRPGGVLWFDPTLVERTGIDAADVPGDARSALESGVSQPTLNRAHRYIANLEERIAELTPPVTTTTTTRPSTSSTSTSSTSTPRVTTSTTP